MSLLVYWKFSNYQNDINNKDKYSFNSNQKRLHDIQIGEDAFFITGLPTHLGFNLFILGHFIIDSKSFNHPDFKYGRYCINGDPTRSDFFHLDMHNPVTPIINNLTSIKHFDDVKTYCHAFQTVRKLNEADTEILKSYVVTLKIKNPGNTSVEDLKESWQNVKPQRNANSYTIQSLKIFYDYHCQICGDMSGTYGGNIVDGHHIQAVSEAGTDDPGNILILCPNHHRLIHDAKGKLNLATKEIYYEKTGKRDKLLLYDHLIPHGKY